MKKIILLLTLITTINFASNPFDSMRLNKAMTKATSSHTRTANISQKLMYAKRAATKGNPRAMFDLGLMYVKGEGVRQDLRLAFTYFHKAARKNHVEAKFYMGLSFAQGKGVKKQSQLARYWFKLAVKAGHPKAMAHLASIEKKLSPQYGKNRRVAFNSVK